MNRDIHTPSAVSAAHTNGVNGAEPMTFAELSAEKLRMEQELSALSSVLDSVGSKVESGTC
jgi:hypothetical protein